MGAAIDEAPPLLPLDGDVSKRKNRLWQSLFASIDINILEETAS